MVVSVHTVTKADIPWVADQFNKEWGGDFVVSRGVKHFPKDLQGFYAADEQGNRVGLVTYEVVGNDCEMVTLNAFTPHRGIGTALVTSLRKLAKAHGCHRLWLVTTNDNLDAVRFYQRRGFQLAAIYPQAIEESCKIKPSIPLEGFYGIPIRDELILEMNIIKADEQR
jgi:N-acetylglutamate synthase-like GNAT family acetyltransferase